MRYPQRSARTVAVAVLAALSMTLISGNANAASSTLAPLDTIHSLEASSQVNRTSASPSAAPEHFTYTAQADGDALLLRVSPEVNFAKQGGVIAVKIGENTLETLPLTVSRGKRGLTHLRYEFVSPSVVRVAPTLDTQDRPGDSPANYGWWKDWGKCAAGIVGGASTGATTGGLGGAAVGTVTVPILGSVPGAAVGAAGGGIGGGLTGAVAAC